MKRSTATIIDIEDVDCPRCNNQGPHDRKTVAMDGCSVVNSCAGCSLEWSVY